MVKIDLIIILCVVVPAWVWYRRTKYLQNKRSFLFSRELLVNITFIYFFGVFYLTMQPFYFNIPLISYREFYFDTELFGELRRMADTHLLHKILYSVGNIFLFVPFGLLLPLLFFKLRHFIVIVPLGFLFSLTIELTQATLTVGRRGTVDDLFFNTIGAMLGYFMFLIIHRAWTKLRQS